MSMVREKLRSPILYKGTLLLRSPNQVITAHIDVVMQKIKYKPK